MADPLSELRNLGVVSAFWLIDSKSQIHQMTLTDRVNKKTVAAITEKVLQILCIYYLASGAAPAKLEVTVLDRTVLGMCYGPYFLILVLEVSRLEPFIRQEIQKILTRARESEGYSTRSPDSSETMNWVSSLQNRLLARERMTARSWDLLQALQTVTGR